MPQMQIPDSGVLLGALATWVRLGTPSTDAGGMNRPPMAETAASLAMDGRAQGAAGRAGFELPKQHRGSGSDGTFTAALEAPTLDGRGCPGAHAAHEHILRRQLVPRAAMLADLVETL